MINSGYKLSIDEIRAFQELKTKDAYRNYLQSISSSPAFMAIIKEHAERVDVTPDLVKLQAENKISFSAEDLNRLFKLSIMRMAGAITADAIILKELEDKKVQDVLDDLVNETNVIYLLGLADPSYYERAKVMVENGEIGPDDLVTRGLIAYLARKEKIEGKLPQREDNGPSQKEQKQERKKSKASSFDVNSNTIRI